MATQAQSAVSIQQEMVRRRAPFVMLGVMILSSTLLLRVISFQFPQDARVSREFATQRDANAGRIETFESARGIIYDRNGYILADNRRRFRIGVSPNLVADPEQTANDLAAILGRDPVEIFNILRSDALYVPLGTIDPDVWQQIDALDLGRAIQEERLFERFYPQAPLASQVIGFVYGQGEDSLGSNGVEGEYQNRLAGVIADQEVSNLPFGVPEDGSVLQVGDDLVLTIDRDIQFLIEQELQRAVVETGAEGGTIIVMDPRTGDVLGMTSYPTYDNNNFADADPDLLNNPAVSDTYEPGSVFKVLTVAAALDLGVITADWVYNDTAVLTVPGGVEIENWDRRAHGLVDTQGVLVQSLNVGAATISNLMGRDNFYLMLSRFNIGTITNIDIQGEEQGQVRIPGDEFWSESDLATNAFGQGIAVTPLQMLTAINAIANEGVIMQPRIVHQIIDGDDIETTRIVALSRPISAITAQLVTDMMVATVRDGFDEAAQLPGYSVAGKTGTAEIPDPGIGYRDDAWIMSFAGFLPADNPQVSILIIIDSPANLENQRWASQVAAPVFRRLAERLVILMEIPNDEIRLALEEQGGMVADTP